MKTGIIVKKHACVVLGLVSSINARTKCCRWDFAALPALARPASPGESLSAGLGPGSEQQLHVDTWMAPRLLRWVGLGTVTHIRTQQRPMARASSHLGGEGGCAAPNCWIIEAQNPSGWKRPLRSSSPAVKPSPPCLLNHVLRCHIYRFFERLQGWWLHHLPRKPVPKSDLSFSKEIFPNMQSKPPLAQLQVTSLSYC